jgi:protein-L-isoaspartate(D-aspartate) O-methyltransferase
MDFALARRNMVESQLRTNRITMPALLDAFKTVPRERFVPTNRRAQAYLDEHVEIAPGRWLMPPMTIGRLIQESYPLPTDNALVVGAGMGYSAAILGRVCNAVFALESDASLVAGMGEALTEQVLDNVVAVEGELTLGYPGEGPYEIILLAGGVEVVPDALTGQLAEGGRLMAVVGAPDTVGRATLFGKRNGAISSRVLFDATVKHLPGFQKAPAFVF